MRQLAFFRVGAIGSATDSESGGWWFDPITRSQFNGTVAEWSMALSWKGSEPFGVPRVRISPVPPFLGKIMKIGDRVRCKIGISNTHGKIHSRFYNVTKDHAPGRWWYVLWGKDKRPYETAESVLEKI